MQFVHTFANSVSGGEKESDAGKLAALNKKKKNKDGSVLRRTVIRDGEEADGLEDEQANSATLIQTRELGARNVQHRDKADGIDLASNANQSEVQRLEHAMKEMIRGFKEKIESAAEKATEAVAVQEMVQRGGDHELDDHNSAQYNPRYTEALLDVPTVHRPQNRFVHDPHHYIIDFIEQSEKSLLKLNGGTWYERCFPEDDPATDFAIEPENYFSPFPGQSSNVGVTDLHVHQATHTTSLTFSLPDITLTHAEFVEAYRPSRAHPDRDGTVQISIPASYLRGLLKDELKNVDWEHTPYHINVFDIVVSSEVSNFLVDFDKVLTSVSAEKPGMLNSWSTPRGVDSNAVNLVTGPDTPEEDKKRYFNKILAHGESNIKHVDRDRFDPLYIAPSFKNGAEHPRWINRNWPELGKELNKIAHGNAYQIKLPPPGKFKDFEFIPWFVLGNMKEISRRTRALGEMPNHKRDGKQCEFGVIYSTDESDTSAYTLICKTVLDGMLKEKKNKFDQASFGVSAGDAAES